jgi:uncharacterized protein YlxP (DUF503 family)
LSNAERRGLLREEGPPGFREGSIALRNPPMVLGVIKLEIWIPGSTSLKGKRSVVKKIIERTRSRFNVTVAEVDKQDVYTRAVIGCAMVGSDQRYVNGALDKILDFVEGLAAAEILSETVEIINL